VNLSPWILLLLSLAIFVGCKPHYDVQSTSTVRSAEAPTVLVISKPAANKTAVEASPKVHATTEAIDAAIRELLARSQTSSDGSSQHPQINSVSQTK
jgi:hypothetical protein